MGEAVSPEFVQGLQEFQLHLAFFASMSAASKTQLRRCLVSVSLIGAFVALPGVLHEKANMREFLARRLVANDASEEEAFGSSCTTRTYHAELALPSNAEAAGMEPPMLLGATENMDARISASGLDLTGLWWMKDNPAASELMSFAGSTVNASTFPMLLKLPSMASGRWAFQNTIKGRGNIADYKRQRPQKGMPFYFENATGAEIGSFLTSVPLLGLEAYHFHYVNADHWLRPSYYAEKSIASGLSGSTNSSYDLLRVVRADGSAHPEYWPEFLEHMANEGTTLINLISDDTCLRRCTLALPCSVCRRLCKLR